MRNLLLLLLYPSIHLFVCISGTKPIKPHIKTSKERQKRQTEKHLRGVNEDRQKVNWQKKHRQIGHVSKHDGLSYENIVCYVALKRAAEDREGWRHRERMSKTFCTAEDC